MYLWFLVDRGENAFPGLPKIHMSYVLDAGAVKKL